ncbi:transposase [Streptomyces alanosinicus]|uniref:Insertion element IS402-like domain-containing protein n=1 Tax=Streptomyces alanosinicus TaxID=68171 RepID=A0A919D8A7_9ACTN|nr:hypothetical protein GCM10010339_78130 [Streptomyces alanosinicus]
MARGDLTQAQWVCLEVVLPGLPVMGRKPRDRRQVFDGIWWRARTDSPWRDVPARYGSWETFTIRHDHPDTMDSSCVPDLP